MNRLEREFLLAVERGELDKVSDYLRTNEPAKFNVNCRDPLDRGALVIAIDNKNSELLELLLLDTNIKVGDALLYAIQDDFVKAVELLLRHSDTKNGCPHQHTAYGNSEANCFFGCDMTPLMLAAQRNNLEIIKLLLDNHVAPIQQPHEPRCACETCCRARAGDCLRHSRSRMNAYKALASHGLMALSSPDPLGAAFEMSAKLEGLAKLEPEYKKEYMRLRAQCQAFATKLLDYTRTSQELEILLNFDDTPWHSPVATPYGEGDRFPWTARSLGDSMEGKSGKDCGGVCVPSGALAGRRARHSQLARLKLAIKCKQKTFCAHPDIQELLASVWYENLPGFRCKSILAQTAQVLCIGFMFPVYSLAYLIAPHTRFGSYIKKPFIKFICHSASYITFIIVLILASQRVEAFYEWSTIMSLFVGERASLLAGGPQMVRLNGGPQQPMVAPAGADSANLSLWKATMNSPPTGSYSDDLEINQLNALYRHTMGSGAGGTSSSRGLESLSKIFEELPASSKKRGTLPSPIESVILLWVLSLIWAELKQLRALGINYYRDDMWNILDSIASGCYIGTIILRIVSYVQSDDRSLEVARERWHAYDPTLLSEGLFATATVFSALKLVYIFSLNPYLGPLQISLGRMIIDIVRFSWIYMLVLFAFACGMNQLLWYYADLERHQCLNVTNYNLAQYYKAKHQLPESAAATTVFVAPAVEATIGAPNASQGAAENVTMPASGEEQDLANMTDEKLMESAFSASLEDDSSMPPVTIDDSCKTWRHFSNVFESTQTLFWANFGLVDLENFDLTGIRQYTRFWALLMFGSYCFINVIVVLNLLIAMMNHSYVKISKRSDIEWKFARTRLWVSYFEHGSTVPAPLNIFPSLKATRYLLGHLRALLCGNSRARHEVQVMELSAKSASKYYAVMRVLVNRYLIDEQRRSGRQSAEAKLRRWAESSDEK